MPKPFDLIRPQLEVQYQDVQFDPASGLSGEELSAALARHRAEDPDEPRILTRAWLFHLLCTRGRVAPDPDDYFADKLEHHNLLHTLRNEWLQQERAREFQDDPPSVPGSFQCILDLSHTSPDWRELLAHGLTGLRDRAAAREGHFYQAVAMVYDGAIALAMRLGEASGNAALSALAERPPRSFHEALQLAYLYHELQEMEGEPVRSMGRFDQLFFPFYRDEIQDGHLTCDQAKELLKFFWIKYYARTGGTAFGKNFLFGPEINELSRLGIEVYREMQTVDPKLSVRLGAETPDDFLGQVVRCIQDGCTGIVIANDPAQVRMLIENGKTPEDAADYLLIGCYEPAVMGKELNCSGAALLNLAKSVELALAECSPDRDCGRGGADRRTECHSVSERPIPADSERIGNPRYDGQPSATPAPPSFDEFLAAYLRALDTQIAAALDQARRYERIWPRVNPSPLLSGTMESCLASGRDVSEAGAQYNTTGALFAGLANAADSLAAVEQLVYRDQHCSMADLKAALAADWKGYEELRLTARHRVPKWGNNDERVDRLAVAVTDFLGRRINHEPNARGGVFQAALYAIIHLAQRFGSQTGALPDGRLAGEPLAINTGASVGMDANGVTSLINSVTRIDLAQFPSGTVLDIMLHPSAVGGKEGLRTISAIIRSHFAQGGMAIQFNIFDPATLREAQRHPERHPNLQVRVCGWNVRFTNLSPEEQDLFIAKAEAVQ